MVKQETAASLALLSTAGGDAIQAVQRLAWALQDMQGATIAECGLCVIHVHRLPEPCKRRGRGVQQMVLSLKEQMSVSATR